MRPGQEAPDDATKEENTLTFVYASMRPGQEAPDDSLPQHLLHNLKHASMRPGQEAPDDGLRGSWTVFPCPCFNEAGARSPG